MLKMHVFAKRSNRQTPSIDILRVQARTSIDENPRALGAVSGLSGRRGLVQSRLLVLGWAVPPSIAFTKNEKH